MERRIKVDQKIMWLLKSLLLSYVLTGLLLMLLITLGVYHTIEDGNVVLTMILCICGGTLGGMLS